MAQISAIELTDGTKRGIRAGAIPYGQVDSTSTATVFTATVAGVTELTDGTCVLLKNGVVTSASGFTLNVNGLGAKNVYSNMAAATAETTIFNVNYTMLFVYDETRDADGGWICYRGYNSDTTTARGYQDYYFRAYAGSALYRYKLVMQGADNRMYPITTTNQTSTTQVVKAVQTVALRPHKIWLYNSTTTISAGAVIGAQTLLPAMYLAGSGYTFNTNVPTYRMIYLCGSYNKDTDLFTLDNSTSTSYFVYVPTNSASVNLASYFTQGKYYILVGGSYSTANYFSLFATNPMYYFDGTNLIPASTQVAKESGGGVQSNWNETDTSSLAYIQNKPTIPVPYEQDAYTGYYNMNSDLNYALVENTVAHRFDLTMNGNTVHLAAMDIYVFMLYASALKCFFFLQDGATFHIYEIYKAVATAFNGESIPTAFDFYLSCVEGNTISYIYLTTDGSGGMDGTLTTYTIPTATSDLTNDSGFITSSALSGYLPTTGGQLTGDLTLYTASGDSKALIFQRGTLSDNYNDWRIQDRGGFLYFDQRGNNSTSWTNMAMINTSGTLTATTFSGNLSWSNVTNKPTIPDGLSISGNTISLMSGSTTVDSITLPVYNGGVT